MDGSNIPSSDPASNLNPLGISPPGMRLRSGKKKKETPIKDGRTPGKRRRNDGGYDTGDDIDNDNEVGAPRPTKRRILETTFEAINEEKDDAIVNDNESDVVMGAEKEKESTVENGDVPQSDKSAEVVPDGKEKETVVIDVEVHQDKEKEKGKVAESTEPVEMDVDKDKEMVDVATAENIESKDKEKEKEASTPITTEVNSILQNEVSSFTNVRVDTNTGATEDASTITPSTYRAQQQSIISPTMNLRLPSQHTPAPEKVDATYKGNALLRDFITPAKPSHNDAIAAAQDYAESPVAFVVNGNGTDSELEGLKLTATKPVEVQEEEEEREDGRRDGLFRYFSSIYVSSGDDEDVVHKKDVNGVTLGLFGFLLFLHISLMYTGTGGRIVAPLWAWRDMSGVADRTLKTYRDMGILSTPPIPEIPKPIMKEEIVKNIVMVDNEVLVERERDLLNTRKKIDWWKAQKNNASKLAQKFGQAVYGEMGVGALLEDDIEDENEENEARLGELKNWERALEQSWTAVKQEAGNLDSITEELLKTSELAITKQSLNVLSFDGVSIPGEDCHGQNFMFESSGGGEIEYMSEDAVLEATNDFNSMISDAYSTIRSGARLFQSIEVWMRDEIQKLVNQNSLNKDISVDHVSISPSKSSSKKSVPTSSLSLTKIQAMIDESIEIGRADMTGKHDFASLRSGANIIYTGSRQTSSSLVENLPLGNQLMAKLGLRFYGNGPSAALEPTFPQGSLGQCWSFETEGERKEITIKEWAIDESEFENEPDRGIFSTLAVKLANPIYVKSVAIEHAPMAALKNRSTAVRKFRVIGFQTDDASREPLLLGTFEYNSQDEEFLQEFEVDTKLENGRPIPKLASVVLAIDSNWGADYSCLYRFRVHGQNKF